MKSIADTEPVLSEFSLILAKRSKALVGRLCRVEDEGGEEESEESEEEETEEEIDETIANVNGRAGRQVARLS